MATQTLTGDTVNTKALLKALVAFKKGDFTVRLPGEWTGEAGKIADTLNDIIELSDKTAREVERVSRVVGKEGKISQSMNSISIIAASWGPDRRKDADMPLMRCPPVRRSPRGPSSGRSPTARRLGGTCWKPICAWWCRWRSRRRRPPRPPAGSASPDGLGAEAPGPEPARDRDG